MREIKFRGLNTSSKEWKYGYLVVDEKYTQIWQQGDVPVIIDPKTVGQYVGLEDKNGKEIYEGDVVKYETGNELNDFIEENVYFGGGAFYPTCTQPGKTFEVIGNIHENPELLDKK